MQQLEIYIPKNEGEEYTDSLDDRMQRATKDLLFEFLVQRNAPALHTDYVLLVDFLRYLKSLPENAQISPAARATFKN